MLLPLIQTVLPLAVLIVIARLSRNYFLKALAYGALGIYIAWTGHSLFQQILSLGQVNR